MGNKRRRHLFYVDSVEGADEFKIGGALIDYLMNPELRESTDNRRFIVRDEVCCEEVSALLDKLLTIEQAESNFESLKRDLDNQ